MLTAFILLSVTTAGYIDLRWQRIPNWLVILTVLVSISWHAAMTGLAGLWMSLAGMLVGTAVLFPLFLIRGMGAADVKFFGALGAAVTYENILTVLVFSLFIAGIMAAFRVVLARAFKSTLANVADIAKRFLHGHFSPHPQANLASDRAIAIPFGVAVAVATWVFVLLRAQ
jgi:prepilin peptidase CpaA